MIDFDANDGFHELITYFISCASGGLIKIGQTTTLRRRMAAFQLHCPHLMVVLATTHTRERTLHKKLRKSRLHGEWFTPTEQVLRQLLKCENVTEDGHRLVAINRAVAAADSSDNPSPKWEDWRKEVEERVRGEVTQNFNKQLERYKRQNPRPSKPAGEPVIHKQKDPPSIRFVKDKLLDTEWLKVSQYFRELYRGPPTEVATCDGALI